MFRYLDMHLGTRQKEWGICAVARKVVLEVEQVITLKGNKDICNNIH